jgi:hypothetical protein
MVFTVKKINLMSFMQYKLTNSYSNVVYQKKRNMDKTIKFPAILLFVFLFSITKVVANNSPVIFTETSVRCTESYDCFQVLYKPNIFIYRCEDGYCGLGIINQKYFESID